MYDRLVPIPLPTGYWIEITMWGTNAVYGGNCGVAFDPYISEIGTFALLSTSITTYDNSYSAQGAAASSPIETNDPNNTNYGILLNWQMYSSASAIWNTKISWYNVSTNNTYNIPMQTDTSSILYTGNPIRQFGVAGVKTTTGTTTTITGFRLLTHLTSAVAPTTPMTYNYRVKVLN